MRTVKIELIDSVSRDYGNAVEFVFLQTLKGIGLVVYAVLTGSKSRVILSPFTVFVPYGKSIELTCFSYAAYAEIFKEFNAFFNTSSTSSLEQNSSNRQYADGCFEY